ncbi:MAG: glycerol-3-phosphate 1-O-acyltransferase PlsY [Turicibacter sp.]|nr:glycerol-3-phosphate 1-O-acyltransferase PlsY [Turicibacter sp.]
MKGLIFIMPSLNSLIFILIAYLIGSFPSGLVIGKVFFKTDIREHGSGNLGGSNAMRVLGKTGGVIVYLLDILKGGLAVFVAMNFQTEMHPLIIAIFSLIGHIYPIFAGFKGGKAVASSSGIILFYAPLMFLTLAAIFFGSLAITKIISLSSVIATVSMFLIVWINPLNNDNFADAVPRVIFALFMILIVVKHIPNFKRIANGTEPKVGQKKHQEAKV